MLQRCCRRTASSQGATAQTMGPCTVFEKAHFQVPTALPRQCVDDVAARADGGYDQVKSDLVNVAVALGKGCVDSKLDMSDKSAAMASRPSIQEAVSEAVQAAGAALSSAAHARDLGIDAARGRRRRATATKARKKAATARVRRARAFKGAGGRRRKLATLGVVNVRAKSSYGVPALCLPPSAVRQARA